MKRHNWTVLAMELEDHNFETIMEAADFLGIPYATVYDAFGRGDLPVEAIAEAGSVSRQLPLDLEHEAEQVEFTEKGNEATLKFKAAEPLSAKEAMEIAGVDSSEWRIESQRIGMWQMGRKDKKVSLIWTKGVMDGYVDDSGKIAKTYLYQIEVKLTRKNRIAVKPVLQPIEIYPGVAIKPASIVTDGLSVLFIADPHFGFRRSMDGSTSLHHRPFIRSLLTIADWVRPNVTIWNGDILDMADWSRFDTEPELLFSTQMAGIELAWVLEQFGRRTNRQIIIEGNHDIRLQKALVKNLAAGYQLTPVHDLDGHPLMSVPRFLGLDNLGVEWVGGYPDAQIQIGSAIFEHGSTVRKGSAKTVSAEMTEATTSRFFGHIHRHEIASKHIADRNQNIWLGSPGCACDKRYVPGANQTHNWQLGAFLIHFDQQSGNVQGVEHIASDLEGPTWFRGQKIERLDYLDDFKASLPTKYINQF